MAFSLFHSLGVGYSCRSGCAYYDMKRDEARQQQWNNISKNTLALFPASCDTGHVVFKENRIKHCFFKFFMSKILYSAHLTLFLEMFYDSLISIVRVSV